MYHVLLRHLTPRHPPHALIHFCTCDTEKLILSRSRLFRCLYSYSVVKVLRGHPPVADHQLLSLVLTNPLMTSSTDENSPAYRAGCLHYRPVYYLIKILFDLGNHYLFVQVIDSSLFIN